MHQLIGLVVLTAIVLVGAAVPASQALRNGDWGSALGLVGWPYIFFYATEWIIYAVNRRSREATIGDGFLPSEVYPGLGVAVVFFIAVFAGRAH